MPERKDSNFKVDLETEEIVLNLASETILTLCPESVQHWSLNSADTEPVDLDRHCGGPSLMAVLGLSVSLSCPTKYPSYY